MKVHIDLEKKSKVSSGPDHGGRTQFSVDRARVDILERSKRQTRQIEKQPLVDDLESCETPTQK